jgi:hypothetical protein
MWFIFKKFKKTYYTKNNNILGETGNTQNTIILDKKEDRLASLSQTNLSYQEQRRKLFATNYSAEEILRPIATRPDRPIPDMTPMSVIIPVYPANKEKEIIPDYKQDSSIPPPAYNDSVI